MQTITVMFTRRRWNPVSWLVRWTLPRSRFALGTSSHCAIVYEDRVLEAHMWHGVREVDFATATRGAVVVKSFQYQVPDAEAGIAWARAQVGRSYDWAGAIGIGLTPGRDWKQDDKWFCYEYVAGVLRAAGRPLFANLTHVSETALMAIDP